MGLTDESRALLQLLLVRGKDYGQIAELLGVDRGEVATRTADALAQLAGGPGQLDPVLTDYMVGQADPITRAEAARLLSEDSDKAAAYAEVRDQLDLLFPGATVPAPPRAETDRVAGSRRDGTPSGKREDLPQSQGVDLQVPPGPRARFAALDGRTAAILAALVAALGLASVIAVVLLLGGGGAEQEVIEEPPPPTVAVLRPPDGGSSRGEVEFGFAGSRFAANVALSDLAPSRPDEGYALWLEGPAGSFPFDSARVGEQGSIAGQSEISQAIICFIAADLFTEVKVSRVGDAQLTSALRRAVDRNLKQADFPDYVGQTVLDGPISMPLESRERIIDVCEGRNPGSSGGSPGS